MLLGGAMDDNKFIKGKNALKVMKLQTVTNENGSLYEKAVDRESTLDTNTILWLLMNL